MKHLYLVSKGILKSGKKEWQPVTQVKFSNFWRCFLNTNWNLSKKLFESVLFLMLSSVTVFLLFACFIIFSFCGLLCLSLLLLHNAYLFSRRDECGCGWKGGEDLEEWWGGFWRSWRKINYNQMLYYENLLF